MMTTTLKNDRDQVLHFVSMMGLGEAPTFGLCLVLVDDAIELHKAVVRSTVFSSECLII